MAFDQKAGLTAEDCDQGGGRPFPECSSQPETLRLFRPTFFLSSFKCKPLYQTTGDSYTQRTCCACASARRSSVGLQHAVPLKELQAGFSRRRAVARPAHGRAESDFQQVLWCTNLAAVFIRAIALDGGLLAAGAMNQGCISQIESALTLKCLILGGQG